VTAHPHAAFDRFPQLLDSLAEEFGRDGVLAIAERVIDAEFADFYWDGRFAEMNCGACEGVDLEDEAFEQVAIAGYFRGRYYVATCTVDAERRVDRIAGLCHCPTYEAAVAKFLSHAA
ncbi:MAG: hypothetical protein KIT82_06970, partial [Bradyrhizobium sp.]|nr:hypothetical protein [Bradyrhizobium sp.]